MAEKKITAANFEQEVLRASGTVLLDFWAPWCGPCRMLGPELSVLAETHEGSLTVGKVNVDEEGELAARFGIASIPTLILFRNGAPVAQQIGFVPRAQLEDFIRTPDRQA